MNLERCRSKKKKGPRKTSDPSCKYCRQRPTLPHSFPCSTIGGIRLNFRVRNGNGCDPDPMTTGILVPGMPPGILCCLGSPLRLLRKLRRDGPINRARCRGAIGRAFLAGTRQREGGSSQTIFQRTLKLELRTRKDSEWCFSVLLSSQFQVRTLELNILQTVVSPEHITQRFLRAWHL